ncbi:MAG: putative acyl-CoA dehydrogenase [Acidimicrobiales bacterium]|nr:putative acyl-CoA dehydrogenase [Acidimicrobiales bacterium]
MADDVRSEVQGWLASHWDPDLEVGAWWELLADSGWAVPMWPEEWHGRGLSRDEANTVTAEIRAAGALGPPGGLGVLLAGPTIVAQGSDEQKRRYLRPIVTGQEAWCQLFSEPEAGSDLAGLRCAAVRDGDEWVVNGQKVWTSGGQFADLGMLMARTDPDVPKHRGISYFAIDMHQPGAVEVRPLREMTGRAMFNEVFLSDARVPHDALIGGLNNGWAVGNTTLMFERAGLGAGGGGAGGTAALPGTLAGHLHKRAGDLVKGSGSGPGSILNGVGAKALIDLARGTGASSDATLRQDLARLHTMQELARYSNLRLKAAKAAGQDVPGLANLSKLAMSAMMRLVRDLGPRILGPAGQLAGKDAPLGGMITELTLFAPAVSIYGGSDEVQHNIIGERVLGLPSEPRTDKTLPFNQLAKSRTGD